MAKLHEPIGPADRMDKSRYIGPPVPGRGRLVGPPVPGGGTGGTTGTALRSDYPGSPEGTPIGMIVDEYYAAAGLAGFWPRMPQHDTIPADPNPPHRGRHHRDPVHEINPIRHGRHRRRHKPAPYPSLHTGSSAATAIRASLRLRGGSDVPFPHHIPPVVH